MNDTENVDINKLHDEIKELKSKMRILKSDRDMISRFTSQVNRELLSLQESHTELVKEKDLYLENLAKLQSSHSTEIRKLTQEKDNIANDLGKAQQSSLEISMELEDTKLELRNINFEYDVIQVDFYKEKEHTKDLNTQLREYRKKYRVLQNELNESDKATTKRLNRLIERLENVEAEKKHLQEQLQSFENDIDTANMLCFVCRAGVKNASCVSCQNKICRKCYESVDTCPFCRRNLSTISDGT